jgi:hypothetical protein
MDLPIRPAQLPAHLITEPSSGCCARTLHKLLRNAPAKLSAGRSRWLQSDSRSDWRSSCSVTSSTCSTKNDAVGMRGQLSLCSHAGIVRPDIAAMPAQQLHALAHAQAGMQDQACVLTMPAACCLLMVPVSVTLTTAAAAWALQARPNSFHHQRRCAGAEALALKKKADHAASHTRHRTWG